MIMCALINVFGCMYKCVLCIFLCVYMCIFVFVFMCLLAKEKQMKKTNKLIAGLYT